MIQFQQPEFVISVHHLNQLPLPELPEIAFAGRSNVGKSSLLNRLLGRKNLVKVSGRPGKTQGLNFFRVDEAVYFVDLPGYGFAQVSRKLQENWQRLISNYIEQRQSLQCVVVIVDIRHPPKKQDRQLFDWLRDRGKHVLPVYTKADKISGNQRHKNIALLDAGFGIHPDDRIIFSAKTGYGIEELKKSLFQFL
ncbi:MAG: ribosome biogenesis GTP-binding protein YihA/YsxC [Desulfocapsaceae bacterium]|nr:ribosome biogenesis GTP-binding protein YihA/YsxC [Desulfocapsaceae bacterium]